jgi:NADH-quinone oxidoreductase subunit C
MVELEGLRQTAAATLGALAEEVWVENGAVLAYVAASNNREALIALRENDSTRCDVMSFMTAVDYTPREPRFDLVYELYSTALKHRVRVKCKLADAGSEDQLPAIASVSDVYLTANWHERECYDLMGIDFTGHPDLRRILLPDRWDGHPLRKEYPFDGKREWGLGKTVIDGSGMEGDLGL